ncbi:MAG TPA: hypothetical protein VGG14_17020 [Candidatus Sulfotelmatobacter sp.]
MKRFAMVAIGFAIAASAWGQAPETAAPQTARQALIEMLFSKNPGTFMKHLPEATLAAIAKSGALTSLQGYSMLATQFQNEAQRKSFQTFETGPVLMTGVSQQSGDKYDVIVDNDSIQGDTDNITISFHTYKGEQLQRTPYMPTLTLAMKQESGVWKLDVVSVTISVPLADPDFLNRITEGMAKAQSHAATALLSQPQARVSVTSFGSDTQVLSAMRTILAAESAYSTTYTSVGYTCTLSDLDGFGAADRNEHQAMLIPSDLAGGRRYGYSFTLSGCTGNPASGFEITATPAGSSFGRRTYCADQAGTIRYSNDGNPATCLASGLPQQ